MKEGYTKEFWIGISVSIVTNLIQSVALAFQQKSHVLNERVLNVSERKGCWKRPMWVISFVSYLIANLTGSVFSIGYLPIVILAPIGAMGLVFNAIASHFILGEPLKKNTILGTILIVMGALMVGWFGVIIEPDHDIQDLIRLYKRPGFIAYFSTLESILVIGLFMTHYFESLYRSSIGKVDQLRKYCGMSYGVISGNISSQSILFAKSGLELILLSFTSDENQFKYALTWIILFMMILTAVLQLYYLNKGLQLCDTVVLIPLSNCTFNLSCLFNGLMYFDQWSRIVWWHLLMVIVGAFITVFGVALISFKSTYKDETTSLLSTKQKSYTTR